MPGLAHPARLAPEARAQRQTLADEAIHLVFWIRKPQGRIQAARQQSCHPGTSRWRDQGRRQHGLQQTGYRIGTEAIAVFKLTAVEVPLPPVGTISPGFLASVTALQLRPAKLAQPTIHKLTLLHPVGHALGGQRRAAGGATQQIHH